MSEIWIDIDTKKSKVLQAKEFDQRQVAIHQISRVVFLPGIELFLDSSCPSSSLFPSRRGPCHESLSMEGWAARTQGSFYCLSPHFLEEEGSHPLKERGSQRQTLWPRVSPRTKLLTN